MGWVGQGGDRGIVGVGVGMGGGVGEAGEVSGGVCDNA